MSSADNHFQDAIKIIEEHSSSFLDRVKRGFQPGPFRASRTNHADYPILSPANKYYYEYAYFVECIEWYIRDELANGIIYDLCVLYGLDCLVPDSKRKYVRFSNESIEQVRPFEFIISKEGKTIGYRYTYIDTNKRYINRLLRRYKLDQIVIIDWKENDQRYQEKFNNDIPDDISDVLTHIHVRDFFSQYFSADVYDEYLKLTRKAVHASHSEISIQVSPTMSLQFLSEFKADRKKWLSGFDFRGLRYKTAELQELPELPDEDYNAIDASFFGDKLYRALVGKESFAESFITSEYMYYVFENGGRFDYTAIVCGYIKSVEQLLGKLLDTTLSHHCTDGLWIKCNRYIYPNHIDNVKYKTGIVCAKEPKRARTVHVRAVPDNYSKFDTTFTPLTWFIYDNSQGWNITAQGIDQINDYLLEYAKEDRNEHFHKDNITEIEDVQRIRNNTILVLYMLLGGYRLSGNPETDIQELGIQDDEYDRFYNSLIVIPKDVKEFVLAFDNDTEIKAERLFDQDQPAYDFYGSVVSTIKFVPVEDYHGRDYLEFEKSLMEDNLLVLSRTCFPEKAWFVRSDGERVSIKW